MMFVSASIASHCPVASIETEVGPPVAVEVLGDRGIAAQAELLRERHRRRCRPWSGPSDTTRRWPAGTPRSPQRPSPSKSPTFGTSLGRPHCANRIREVTGTRPQHRPRRRSTAGRPPDRCGRRHRSRPASASSPFRPNWTWRAARRVHDEPEAVRRTEDGDVRPVIAVEVARDADIAAEAPLRRAVGGEPRAREALIPQYGTPPTAR